MVKDRDHIHFDTLDNFCLIHKLELDHVLLSRSIGVCLCNSLCYNDNPFLSHFKRLAR